MIKKYIKPHPWMLHLRKSKWVGKRINTSCVQNQKYTSQKDLHLWNESFQLVPRWNNYIFLLFLFDFEALWLRSAMPSFVYQFLYQFLLTVQLLIDLQYKLTIKFRIGIPLQLMRWRWRACRWWFFILFQIIRIVRRQMF